MITDIKYTDHAFERMTERDITRPMVEAVVAAGECVEQRHGTKRYRLEGLVVVVDDGCVVTAFFDSDAKCRRGCWNPKKRQRRCRRDQELKPNYFAGRGKINVRLQAQYMKHLEVKP